MQDKIQYYRQPMVTATGILLGFLLDFAIKWAPKKLQLDNLRDAVSIISLVSSITFLSLVLYRMLSMNYPVDNSEKYYKTTLLFFMLALGCILMGLLIAIVYSFF